VQKGIFGGVSARDGAIAAYMEVLAAAPKNPFLRSRLP
jgi:hypothetical protein